MNPDGNNYEKSGTDPGCMQNAKSFILSVNTSAEGTRHFCPSSASLRDVSPFVIRFQLLASKGTSLQANYHPPAVQQYAKYPRETAEVVPGSDILSPGNLTPVISETKPCTVAMLTWSQPK